jgi:hypothetical protein
MERARQFTYTLQQLETIEEKIPSTYSKETKSA